MVLLFSFVKRGKRSPSLTIPSPEWNLKAAFERPCQCRLGKYVVLVVRAEGYAFGLFPPSHPLQYHVLLVDSTIRVLFMQVN